MVLAFQLTLNHVRKEARRSIEAFALKADPPQKRRYYRYFRDGPEGGSRGSEQDLNAKTTHTALEDAEKELELKNWRTTYTTTNNQLGDTLRQVQMTAQGDKLGILQPLLRELFNPEAMREVTKLVDGLTAQELDDFLLLMRSLSISFEQDRTAFSSEYIVKYVEPIIDPGTRAVPVVGGGTLGPPISYAPRRKRVPLPPPPQRTGTPMAPKPAPKPIENKGLLEWGGAEQGITSTYSKVGLGGWPAGDRGFALQERAEPAGGGRRESGRSPQAFALSAERRHEDEGGRLFHAKPLGNKHNVAGPAPALATSSCGRTIPDSLVPASHRRGHGLLAADLEDRHMVRHTHVSAQPSWHLLHRDGVVMDRDGRADGSGREAEKTVYMKDFVVQESTMGRAKPTLNPFATDITIGLSDFPYHVTTYQATMGRSATMDYDRSLI